MSNSIQYRHLLLNHLLDFGGTQFPKAVAIHLIEQLLQQVFEYHFRPQTSQLDFIVTFQGLPF